MKQKIWCRTSFFRRSAAGPVTSLIRIVALGSLPFAETVFFVFRREMPEWWNCPDNEAAVEALAATAVFNEVQNADPEQSFFSSFLDEEVVPALDGLSGPFREIVVLSDLEGFTYAEAAEVLGLPVGTVKSRLFRGRRLLQEKLYAYALEMGYIRPREKNAG